MSRSNPKSTEGGSSKRHPDLLAGQHFPPPPKQERSRRKRDALLQSALALFAEQGYEAASIEEMAHRAHVAVGAFYQHFTSKRQVLLVLMNRLLDEATGLSAQAGVLDVRQVRSAIEHIVRRGLQVDWAYAGAYRAWREAVVQDQELWRLHQQIERWTARQIEDMLQALLQVPGARQDIDVETMAWILGLLFWRLAEVPLEEPDAIITSVTHLIYHAIFLDSTDH